MYNSLIAVEGAVDQVYIGNCLQLIGFNKFKGKHIVDMRTPWRSFIPDISTISLDPPLLNIPRFYELTNSHFVAVVNGRGKEGIKKEMSTRLERGRDDLLLSLQSFAVFVDADTDEPNKLAQQFSETFSIYFPNFPSKPGIINELIPRSGIFVFPDNKSNGTIENILCECGETVYSDLFKHASQFSESAGFKYKRKWKSADSKKSSIAATASIIRPGDSNVVTVEKDEWVSEVTKKLPAVVSTLTFLNQLLQLP